MPSPFPGMNPYMEQEDVWHDFHGRLVTKLADSLTSLIRPKYIAKIDENVYIHELSADERFLLGRPDVGVLANRGPEGAAAVATTARTKRAPALGHIVPATDILREPFIEIRDRQTRQLITVIELLSPSNKESGPDREQYLAKRNRILSSPVHLVEIDLLRGGPRMPIGDLPTCDYYVMVSRAAERPSVELWPIRLREPLPEIPIPLRSDDPDAIVSLQALIQDVFDAAGYEDYIYHGTPQSPLNADDAAWAQGLIG